MKNFLKQFVFGLLALAVVVFGIIQLNLLMGESIEVENAYYATAEKLVTADAYLFRDEKPLTATDGGTLCCFFNDGEKVSKGSEVLKIYVDSADAELQEQINLLNAKISILEESRVDKSYSTSDINALDADISSRIHGMISEIGKGSLTMAQLGKDELLTLMNRHYSLTRTLGDFNMVIDKYKSDIKLLQSQLRGNFTSVSTDESGYFYSTVDGYENIFTMNVYNNLTIEQFNSFKDLLPDQTLIASSAGKVIKAVRWYITFKLDEKTVSRLSEAKNPSGKYTIRFPYSDGKTIDMNLEKVISQTNFDYSVVVFSSDLLPSNFNYTRNQPVMLLLNQYSGLKVPSSAMRVVDGKVGVYTLNGTVVKFKTANVLYEENGYCYCDFPTDDINTLSKTKLSLYDPVITSGKDIYEGKIIR